MSKVHQALQKVSNQGSSNRGSVEPSFLETVERDFIQSLKQNGPDTKDDPKPVPGRISPCHQPQEPSDPRAPVESELVSMAGRNSFANERFRALKAKLYQMRDGKSLKTILVTSAVPWEGKTFTAVNLALTIAQEIGQKVLLVDADLRKPSIDKVLGVSKEKGLADFLGQGSPATKIVLKTNFSNLHVVQAGNISQRPTELLNTQGMREFLASAAEQFDWVIVDSPPIVPLADAELISTLVDGVLLVVRAYHTPTSLITKAVQTLQGRNVLGIVFNGIEKSRGPKYDYYSYDYGRS
jgi:capsular exopolysaccharide synthesis family protein